MELNNLKVKLFEEYSKQHNFFSCFLKSRQDKLSKFLEKLDWDVVYAKWNREHIRPSRDRECKEMKKIIDRANDGKKIALVIDDIGAIPISVMQLAVQQAVVINDGLIVLEEGARFALIFTSEKSWNLPDYVANKVNLTLHLED
jgi:hypothetical protein